MCPLAGHAQHNVVPVPLAGWTPLMTKWLPRVSFCPSSLLSFCPPAQLGRFSAERLGQAVGTFLKFLLHSDLVESLDKNVNCYESYLIPVR